MRIEAKIAGQRRELFTPYEIEWPIAKELTLHELIDAVVRQEVAAFRSRQQQRQLDRVLTPQRINEDASAGKVDPAAKETPTAVNEENAVEVALEAFDDGLYFVFVDGRQLQTLSDVVHVVPTSTLLFVRLTPLVGG